MPSLNQAQIDYIAGQRLGRMATAGSDGKPHVVPVAVRYNAELDTVEIGGYNFGARKKYRDVQANPWAAIVIDDVVSVDPWQVRMLEIRGRAEALPTGGAEVMAGFADEMIRIHADTVNAYGIE
jgi:pyridoxamine 5'-phosphate oxidase family protein